MYSSNDTFTIMTSTVHTIGTYLVLDANTIHKKRPSTFRTRSFCIIALYGTDYGCLILTKDMMY